VDCDCRTLPGTSQPELLGELREALGTDVPYELEVFEPSVGGTVSAIDTPLFDACQAFLHAHDPQAVLLPTICTGFTDSHFVREAFGSTAYGIWPLRTTPYETATAGVHAHDERIHVDDLRYATQFHLEVCRSLLGAGTPAVESRP
jgi:acetylornithine deacetylase/succinyl-diaminopimelate desuccinylase-like protein